MVDYKAVCDVQHCLWYKGSTKVFVKWRAVFVSLRKVSFVCVCVFFSGGFSFQHFCFQEVITLLSRIPSQKQMFSGYIAGYLRSRLVVGSGKIWTMCQKQAQFSWFFLREDHIPPPIPLCFDFVHSSFCCCCFTGEQTTEMVPHRFQKNDSFRRLSENVLMGDPKKKKTKKQKKRRKNIRLPNFVVWMSFWIYRERLLAPILLRSGCVCWKLIGNVGKGNGANRLHWTNRQIDPERVNVVETRKLFTDQ